MARQAMELTQPLADHPAALPRHGENVLHDLGGSTLRPIRHPPLEGDRRGSFDVALYGLGEIPRPARAPILAVGEDLDPRLPLQLKGLQNGLVLDLTKLLQRDLSLLVRGVRLQHLRWTQQAAHLLGSITRWHR